MNSARKHAAWALLFVVIAGCADRKAKTAPPPQAQAPAIDAGKAGALYPPPLTPPQAQTQEPAPPPPPVVAKPEPASPPQPAPAATKKPATGRKQKPSAAKPAAGSAAAPSAATAGGDPASPAAAAPAQTPPEKTEAAADVAAAGQPAAASPIGQLTTGNASAQTQTRKETSDLIANTENGLNGIKRTLTAQEQETASQIRTFLTKAKTALSNQDLDGALILATKAKVLLDELNKT